MTSERVAYLAKCSNRELWLRSEIRNIEIDICWQKQRISNANEEWIATGAKCELWHKKQLLMTLRHEVARLKGMDRVVEPYEVMRFGFGANVPKVSYNCECFEPIDRKHKYCPNCGRRILWEKVR